MKMTTLVWRAFVNVGRADDEVEVVNQPVGEALKSLVEWIATRDLRQRFVVLIGRDEDHIWNQVKKLKSGYGVSKDEIADDVENMLESLIAGIDVSKGGEA